MQGADHTDVGLICQETAVLMERTKRLPQARDLLQRALDIRAVSVSLPSPCTLELSRYDLLFGQRIMLKCHGRWRECVPL